MADDRRSLTPGIEAKAKMTAPAMASSIVEAQEVVGGPSLCVAEIDLHWPNSKAPRLYTVN
jgi:hypothetical protein